jgi:hypothetical protein
LLGKRKVRILDLEVETKRHSVFLEVMRKVFLEVTRKVF